MKLDKYFCSTRKFVFNKYNTIKGPGANHNSFADASTKQREKHISSTAANIYRLLESEKENKSELSEQRVKRNETRGKGGGAKARRGR